MHGDHHTHKGFATAEGTAAFAARKDGIAADFWSEAEGLQVASVGIGTYLGAADDRADERYVEAIRRAVNLGCNHVDTAVNYRCQRSERAVGEALERLLHAKECRRSEVLVATKGGFVPFDGNPPPDPAAHVRREVVDAGLARPEEIVAGCHCLAPSYLRAMVKRSLANMRLDTIDVYYLHNPEQQLEEVPRALFLDRVRAAFAALEEEVAAGTIRSYGTATWNGYRVPPESGGHLSLAEIVAAARDAGGEGHHFRFVQLPYNLRMKEAAARPTQEVAANRMTLLAAARALGVHVITSGSLMQSQLAQGQPAAVVSALPGLSSAAQRALQFARSTPGVMTALAGMSQVAHVEENLGVRAVARASAAAIEAL